MTVLEPSVAWLLLAATLLGSTFQGAVGFGLGFTVVPVLAATDPEAIPTVPLLISVPLLVATVVRDLRRTDLRGSGIIALGRLPGTALGAALLVTLPGRILGGAVGVVLLITVGIGSLRSARRLTVKNRLVAGFMSGLMGTAAGVGGPPVSLIYRGQAAPVLRATVGVALLAGVMMSLTAVTLAGRWRVDHAMVALMLLPAALVGFVTSGRVNQRLNQTALQRAVLGLGAVAGTWTIVDSLWL